MVGARFFLQPQGPKLTQERKECSSAQPQIAMAGMTAGNQQPVESVQGRTQERKCRPGAIQTPEPAAQSGGLGHTIRIQDGRRRRLPAKTVDEVVFQCLAAGDQAVVTIRRRKRRKESKCLTAKITESAADLDPIVIFVMRLFSSAAMADDGFAQTKRAHPKDRPSASRGPLGFQFALCIRK